jgi:hypothetical protein
MYTRGTPASRTRPTSPRQFGRADRSRSRRISSGRCRRDDPLLSMRSASARSSADSTSSLVRKRRKTFTDQGGGIASFTTAPGVMRYQPTSGARRWRPRRAQLLPSRPASERLRAAAATRRPPLHRTGRERREVVAPQCTQRLIDRRTAPTLREVDTDRGVVVFRRAGPTVTTSRPSDKRSIAQHLGDGHGPHHDETVVARVISPECSIIAATVGPSATAPKHHVIVDGQRAEAQSRAPPSCTPRDDRACGWPPKPSAEMRRSPDVPPVSRRHVATNGRARYAALSGVMTLDVVAAFAGDLPGVTEGECHGNRTWSGQSLAGSDRSAGRPPSFGKRSHPAGRLRRGRRRHR